MNLIQRGTTASRANRGKSVKHSIAQRNESGSYGGNAVTNVGRFNSRIFVIPYPEIE
jgi:hypothetical protein